ncbi:MAG: hypothetical protein WDO06_01515 [Actinomycetota bacterium]
MPHNLGAENSPASLIARKPKNPLLNEISALIGPIIYTTLLTDSGHPHQEFERTIASREENYHYRHQFWRN